MKHSRQALLVLVTAPELKTARRLARLALKEHLVACANLVPKLESHYWWQGKVESSAEVLLLLKTTAASVKALEKLILAHHPYDTPEFVVLSIRGASRWYLQWWEALGRPASRRAQG